MTDAEAAQMVDPGTLADLAERLTSVPTGTAAAGDAAGTATWQSPTRRRRLLIAISAVAALAVTALLVTSLGVVTFSPGGPAEHTGGVRNPISWNGNLYPLGPPGGILGAKKTTVAGAQAAVGYPVPVPRTAAASRANLTQAWVASRVGRQAALVFDKGKVDILMRPPPARALCAGSGPLSVPAGYEHGSSGSAPSAALVQLRGARPIKRFHALPVPSLAHSLGRIGAPLARLPDHLS